MSRRRVGPDQAPRPFGRPLRLSVEYHVRLPAAVADAIDRDAKDAGYPSGVAFIRALASERRPPYVLKHRVYAALLRQLVRLGNNLNQLARAVNAGRAPYLDLEAIDDSRALLKRIHAFLLDPNS